MQCCTVHCTEHSSDELKFFYNEIRGQLWGLTTTVTEGGAKSWNYKVCFYLQCLFFILNPSSILQLKETRNVPHRKNFLIYEESKFFYTGRINTEMNKINNLSPKLCSSNLMEECYILGSFVGFLILKVSYLHLSRHQLL